MKVFRQYVEITATCRHIYISSNCADKSQAVAFYCKNDGLLRFFRRSAKVTYELFLKVNSYAIQLMYYLCILKYIS